MAINFNSVTNKKETSKINFGSLIPVKNKKTTTKKIDPSVPNPFLGPINTYQEFKNFPAPKPNLTVKLPTKMAGSTAPSGTIKQAERATATQKEILSVVPSAYNNFTAKLKESFDAEKEDLLAGRISGTKAFGKRLEVLTSGAGLILSPVSTAFTASEKLPGVAGVPGKVVNKAFEVAGTIGGSYAGKAIDILPISPEAKKNLRPAIVEIGSFAGQAVLGKIAHATTKKVMPKKAIKEIQNDYINNVKSEALAETREITPEVAREVSVRAAEKTIENLNKVPQEVVKTETYKPRQTVAGEKFVPKATSDFEVRMKEQGLLPENFESLPIGERITFADQAVRTTEFVKNNIDNARAVLRGESPLPSDMRSPFFLKAIEDLIKETKDDKLVHELMNTPMNAGTSIHAQELVSMRALSPDSLSSIAADVKNTRVKNVEKIKETTKKQAVDGLKNETRKAAPKVKDWSAFIDSLKCK